MLCCYYLDYRHPRADIDKQVGENVRLSRLEAELRVCMLGINKSLMRNVPQHKVTALDQAGHLILFVHSAEMQKTKKQKKTASTSHSPELKGVVLVW